jgi:hypothetical protein
MILLLLQETLMQLFSVAGSNLSIDGRVVNNAFTMLVMVLIIVGYYKYIDSQQ